MEQVVSTTDEGAKSTWWQEYRDLFSQDFIKFLGLENSAVRIRQFQGLLVPGLLQSPSYVRQLVQLGNYGDEVVRCGFDIRMKRQELLSDHGPEMFFILDESTLYRQVGDAAVMREQLTQLRDVARSARVSVRIVPYAAGVHRGMKGSFELIELSSEPNDYALLLEQPYDDELKEEPSDEVREFVEIFRELEEIALSTADSLRVIDDQLKELEKDRWRRDPRRPS